MRYIRHSMHTTGRLFEAVFSCGAKIAHALVSSRGRRIPLHRTKYLTDLLT